MGEQDITLTSYWPRWRHKSPASRLFAQPFIQTQIKENLKAPRHWSFCGEFTGTGEFPAQRASYAENACIWWRHHEIRKKATCTTSHMTCTEVCLNCLIPSVLGEPRTLFTHNLQACFTSACAVVLNSLHDSFTTLSPVLGNKWVITSHKKTFQIFHRWPWLRMLYFNRTYLHDL